MGGGGGGEITFYKKIVYSVLTDEDHYILKLVRSIF